MSYVHWFLYRARPAATQLNVHSRQPKRPRPIQVADLSDRFCSEDIPVEGTVSEVEYWDGKAGRRRIKNQVWSGIRESNPRLDLGKVAYYHYTNPAHGKMCDVFIYSMGMGSGQEPDRERFAATLPCGLIHFHNSGRFHHRGFFLPLRKFQRAVAVDVDAGEFFAVTVIHGDLPMMMLAAAIAAHSAGLL